MKLATIHDGTTDGRLVAVERNLRRVVAAEGIARTLQDALERWEAVVEPLQALYEGLNRDTVSQALASDAVRFMAPLPRAWQWLDGSAFPQHAILMAEAFKHPLSRPIFATDVPGFVAPVPWTHRRYPFLPKRMASTRG
jgi:fumarylacetoacetate (FAA) hydrolase